LKGAADVIADCLFRVYGVGEIRSTDGLVFSVVLVHHVCGLECGDGSFGEHACLNAIQRRHGG
jgi:hypothetical protein